MSEQRTEEFSAPRVSVNLAVSGDVQSTDKPSDASSAEAPRPAVAQGNTESARNEPPAPAKTAIPEKGREQKVKKVSAAQVALQSRLPALADDGDLGVEKEQTVTRDAKADLLFMGTLLASAAPSSAPKGKWQEYRVYLTNGGKHVFSKTGRSVFEDEQDSHSADVFEPHPASMSSQLMRSAREITHAKPMTWMDAAVAFFGYDPLAKALYRKLDVRFEEQIT